MSPPNENNSRFYIDPFDPLFLHPSDHPGMMLVSKPFDGSNFSAWKKSIAIALSAKNKLSFVNGHIVKPDVNDQMLHNWQRCNDMVTSWLLNALAPDIAESVLYSETAHHIWKELNDRYGQANGAKLYQLQKDIISIDQGSGDIASYYTRFKKAWDELTSLRLLPPCTCACLQTTLKYEEDQKLIQFLMGLNSDYNTIRGNLLMMIPFPNLNQAYAILIQEEKQREVHASSKFFSDSAAMNASNRLPNSLGFRPQNENRNTAEFKRSVVCHHCKKVGHTSNKCYRLIGFPKDFKFTKGKKVAAGVINSDNLDYTDMISTGKEEQKENNGLKLTNEEYSQIMRLLDRARIQDKQVGPSAHSVVSPANFSGPFTEGTISSW